MATRPLVFLVPDAFGSHLADVKGRVWLDEITLRNGGLSRLAMSSAGVRSDGVIAAMYRSIVVALEARFDVNAFDYDWRQPVQQSAAALSVAVRLALSRDARRVHVVGHGLGGLVAIAMLANDEEILKQIAERCGRIVALGAPFGGSWDIARLRVGLHPLPRLLAKLAGQPEPDPTVVDVLAGWPALSESVAPRRADVPTSVLALLTCVAGTGVPTCAASVNTDAARLLCRTDGDGVVLVRDATVEAAHTAVVQCTHAELVAKDDAIQICLELLAPGARQDAAIVRPPDALESQEAGREDPPPETITSVELIEAASGASARTITLVFPLSVSVVHGHLRQAKYSLAIGHYRDDTIVSAEAALDAAMGGRLTRRLDLDVYVGSEGTVEIIRTPRSRPPGAIVIGLGEVGNLSPELLTKLIGEAAVRHAVEIAETRGSGGRWCSAAMSSLLIGTDSGGSVSLADSISAIVRGVLEANRRLRAGGLWNRVRVDHIEFVELFEDVSARAAHVVNRLPETMRSELGKSEDIVAVSQVLSLPGGEFLRPPDNQRRQGWWRRVQVRGNRAAAPSGAAGAAAIELVYTPLSERARLQQSTTVQSMSQVDALLKAAMTETVVDLKLCNALLELLVPGSVKEYIRGGGDLLLLLDRSAARYPFELMAERTRDRFAPLVSRCGLLRQLETPDTPSRPESATGRDILVIGPPLAPSWRPLPGARDEAHRIKSLCEARGFRPTLVVNEPSRVVQTELFASDARILHIAAHGQYSDDPLQSGVVIGDDEYFTTAQMTAMRRVPELVFLNCCHLARLGPVSNPSPYPALASSLAEGFIRAGVRAVVAAGWTVDDAAGLTFAQTFYERFLDGDLFGEAVRDARIETYKRHGATSTWGAYQCYGSPEYRFRTSVTSPRGGPRGAPVSRSELIAGLRSLAGRAGGARGADAQALVQEFDRLRDQLIDGGRWRDGETLAELASVAAELEDFGQAIALYREALGVSKALAPLRAVEQLANILSRQAPRLAVASGSTAAVDAIKLFEEARKWLNWLDRGLKPTGERLALRGALHKRWAMLTNGAERRRQLVAARKAYGRAREQSNDESYQALNWLAIQYLLARSGRQPKLVALARKVHSDAREKEEKASEPSFWDRVAIPDALLHVKLFDGALTNTASVTEIVQAYESALAAGPSARERASVRDHLQFLADMLGDQRLKRDQAPSAALQPILDLFTR